MKRVSMICIAVIVFLLLPLVRPHMSFGDENGKVFKADLGLKGPVLYIDYADTVKQLRIDFVFLRGVADVLTLRGFWFREREKELITTERDSFLFWEVAWRNRRTNEDTIYNKLYVVPANLPYSGGGKFRVVFEVSAEKDGHIYRETFSFDIVCTPAILSDHKTAGGSKNTIRWMPSKNAKFHSIYALDLDEMKVIQIGSAANQPNLSKRNEVVIYTTHFDGLVPGHRYKYVLKAFRKSDNQEIQSAPVIIEQDGTPPQPVMNLTAHLVPDGKVKLRWEYNMEANPDLRGFYIYRREGQNELILVDSLVVGAEDPVTFYFTDTPEGGLEEGKWYQYKVFAYDTLFNISASPFTEYVQPDATPPPEPLFLWDSLSYRYSKKASQFYSDQRYDTLYYQIGVKNKIKFLNPNINLDKNSLNRADSVCIQWVRDHSHLFYDIDPLKYGKHNVFSTGWISFDDSKLIQTNDGKAFIYELDFSLGGIVSIDTIHGHLYKYRIAFKDRAGNVSGWSRDGVSSERKLKFYVGAIQDCYPPPDVSYLKAIPEVYENNTRATIQIQWQSEDEYVSGIEYFEVYRIGQLGDLKKVVRLDTVRFENGKMRYVIHDTLPGGSYGEGFLARYAVIPVDRVGNKKSIGPGEEKLEIPVVEAKFKLGPRITYIDEDPRYAVYADSLRFQVRYLTNNLSLDSAKPFSVYVDGISVPCKVYPLQESLWKVIAYSDYLLTVDSLRVFIVARYADGDSSLNSNMLSFRRDHDRPDFTLAARNNPDSSYSPCDKGSDYPALTVNFLDQDIDSIAILRERSGKDIVLYHRKYPERVVKFIDSLAAPLVEYIYKVRVWDYAGNLTEKQIEAFGTAAPRFRILSYSTKSETLKYEILIPKVIFENSKSAVYAIFIHEKPMSYSELCDTIPVQIGPRPDGYGVTKDTVIFNTQYVKITDSYYPLPPNNEVEYYYVYARGQWIEKNRFTAFAGDSCNSSSEIDLCDLKINGADLPGFGQILLFWEIKDHNHSGCVQPDTFRIVRALAGRHDTIYVGDSFFLADTSLHGSEKRSITYELVPGKRLSSRNVERVFWSRNAYGYSIVDTERGVLPRITFWTDAHHARMRSSSDSIYFNVPNVMAIISNVPEADSVCINKLNKLDLHLYSSKNKTGYHSIESLGFGPDSVKFSKLWTDPRLGFMGHGDTLYVRYAFNDSILARYGFSQVWMGPLIAVLDKKGPEIPAYDVGITAASSADSASVDVFVFFKGKFFDRLSGMVDSLRLQFKIQNRTSVDTTISYSRNSESESYFWTPPDTLRIRNVPIHSVGALRIETMVWDRLRNISRLDIRDIPIPMYFDFDLKLEVLAEQKVKLTWRKIDKAQYYVVNHFDNLDLLGNPRMSDFINVRDTTLEKIVFSETRFFHVMAVLENGKCTNWSEVVKYPPEEKREGAPIISGMEEAGEEIPDKFELYPLYPNPFNSSTTVRYDLPLPARVRIRVFNIRGQVVRSLFDGNQKPGVHRIIWDGRDHYNRLVPSGVYFVLIETEKFRRLRKCVLLR